MTSYYVGLAEYGIAALHELFTTEPKLTFMTLNMVLGARVIARLRVYFCA
jgi:hypothetical protein